MVKFKLEVSGTLTLTDEAAESWTKKSDAEKAQFFIQASEGIKELITDEIHGDEMVADISVNTYELVTEVSE